MRKYYQAVLALTAAVSLLALLVYRHEYNRLQLVLQVLNYFGSPQKVNSTCPSLILPAADEPNFATVLSSWQRLSDDLYVYSAYINTQGELQAIAFGAGALKLSCSVLLDDSIHPLPGKFAYLSMNDTNSSISGKKYSGYLLTCRYPKTDSQIVAASFFEEKSTNQPSILQVSPLSIHANRTGNVICVAPTRSLRRRDMISFLAFHDHLGWDNFVIYDAGVSPVFNSALQRMARVSSTQWNFTYATIPWNFPFNVPERVVSRLVEADCLYRTYGRATLATTLAWDEYINLKYHNSVEDVFADFQKVSNKDVSKLRLRIRVLCVDEAEGELLTSTPVILRTTRGLRAIIMNESRFIHKLDGILNAATVAEQIVDDVMGIYRYRVCEVEDRREIIDGGVLRFADVMPNAQIFQQYIVGRLFGD